MKKRLMISLFSIAILAGGSLAQALPAGREWALTYLKGVKLGPSTAYISIDAAGKNFTGNTGCNIVNGTVEIGRNSIKFDAVITTKRACIIATAKTESAMLSALNNATAYQGSQDRFRVYQGKELLMVFERVAKPEPDDEPRSVADSLNIEDRKWMLESIAGSALPKVQEEAFINFDAEKGSAGGNTSCNVFGGSYNIDGDKIGFADTISTMRACIEDKRMDIERGFLDGLGEANRYEVHADKLMLYHDRKLLLTFVGRQKK